LPPWPNNLLKSLKDCPWRAPKVTARVVSRRPAIHAFSIASRNITKNSSSGQNSVRSHPLHVSSSAVPPVSQKNEPVFIETGAQSGSMLPLGGIKEEKRQNG
jgi:hypothetical protein